MTKLRIAILGASGIGKYHAREFYNSGAEIIAILGSSKKSSEKTAEKLKELFKIDSKPYSDLTKLLGSEELDIATICTPAALHEIQVRKCLEKGLHVLCEKPFILNQNKKNYKSAKKLVGMANDKNLILTVNTQWPSVIPWIKRYANLNRITDFFMYGEPGQNGPNMLPEFLPHTNSMLIKLFGHGELKNIKFPIKTENEIMVYFNYVSASKKCNVKYNLKYNPRKPRKLSFSVNGNDFIRKIGKNYKQSLIFKDKTINIEDPFKVSIIKFMQACSAGTEPLISNDEILENVCHQDIISKKYFSCL